MVGVSPFHDNTAGHISVPPRSTNPPRYTTSAAGKLTFTRDVAPGGAPDTAAPTRHKGQHGSDTKPRSEWRRQSAAKRMDQPAPPLKHTRQQPSLHRRRMLRADRGDECPPTDAENARLQTAQPLAD